MVVAILSSLIMTSKPLGRSMFHRCKMTRGLRCDLVFFDVQGYDVRINRELQFASSQSSESEWLVFSGATCLAGGVVVIVDKPVFSDIGLLFERYDGWTRDIGAVNPEVQKEWRLFRDELPWFQMTVQTDSWIFVLSERKVIMKTLHYLKK